MGLGPCKGLWRPEGFHVCFLILSFPLFFPLLISLPISHSLFSLVIFIALFFFFISLSFLSYFFLPTLKRNGNNYIHSPYPSGTVLSTLLTATAGILMSIMRYLISTNSIFQVRTLRLRG